MNWISFIKENKSLITFGLMLTFFSSFGQTFLISMYVPALTSEFGFSNGAFGSLYGLATLASAFSLTYAGKLIDRTSLKNYTLFAVISLGLSLMITAFSVHPIMLFIGLWGVRFSGQGLMTHISATSMSRYFDRTRGKALSITALGHPIGEAFLPFVITVLIYSIGWQESLMTCAAVLLLVFVPFIKRGMSFQEPKQEDKRAAKDEQQWSQRQVLKSKSFYMLVPGIFLLPMITTGLFFYQIALSEYKGWSAGWLAACFIGYAIGSSSFMILSGPLVDRFTARRLFPYYLIPVGIGLALMLFFSHPWIAIPYMVLMGASVGLGSTIKSAAQAEMFGVSSIGAVRSLFTTITVISTAVGPALFGFMLDHGLTFYEVFSFCLLLTVAVIIQNFRVLPAFRRKRIYLKFRVNQIIALKNDRRDLFGADVQEN
jgi:MFS family permease